MIDQIRYTWQNLLITSILLLTGILVIPVMQEEIPLGHFIITLLSVSVINLIAWYVMAQGIRKSNREGVVVLMAGIGLKFLLYLLYILVFWLVTKMLTKPFIITFFALYLVFTFLLAWNLFKLLKNK
jgi:hypothetical protein